MISVVVAEGPLRDRVLEARCQSPHIGLSSRACGLLHAAQMKTTWGRQRQRTSALTDGHEILASAEQYDLTGVFDGRLVRICGIGPVQSDTGHTGQLVSGARVGALLQALIAREPMEQRPTIRAWLPPGFMPPQVTVVSATPSAETFRVRVLDQSKIVPRLSSEDVLFWRNDFL